MDDFATVYMRYFMAAMPLSGKLSFSELNAHFFALSSTSHWQSKKTLFERNVNLIPGLAVNTSDRWQQHLQGYIARDNLFFYMDKINPNWVAKNIDISGISGAVKQDFLSDQPKILLCFHSFLHMLAPLLLANLFGPVHVLALDAKLAGEGGLVPYYLQMYSRMEKSLAGGSILPVAGDSTSQSVSKTREVLAGGGIVYTAIDMFPANLNVNNITHLSGEIFNYSLMSGLIDIGIKADALFYVPLVRFLPSGKLTFDLYALPRGDKLAILQKYIALLEGELLCNPAFWEVLSNRNCVLAHR